MNEKVYTFGKDGCLVGIVTEPNGDLQKESTPAVLLWNAGLLHRVGPYRLYVDVGRKLASLGFLVFRFDLSGKGDSETRKDSRSYEQRAVGDIQEAMDFLSAKKGMDEFVLMGLCSGADEAHPVAVVDSRVTGAVLLDGYGYRTWGFYMRRCGPRLLNLRAWKNFLKRKYSNVSLKSREARSENDIKKQIFEREFPPKKEVEADLVKLIERGVNLLYIYSGGVKYGYYNYLGQFKAMFRSIDFQDKIQLEYFDEADHTYTLLTDRDKLITSICDWMQDHYK